MALHPISEGCMTKLGRKDTLTRVEIVVGIDVDASRNFLIYLAVLGLLVYLVITRQMGLQLLLQVDERVLLELPLA
jgi:hypothetical protein